MSDDRQAIEDYAQAYERCLPGPARDKTRSRAELAAHLYDAAEAGELAEAMQRLGAPDRPRASRSPWPGRSWCWPSGKAAPAPRPASGCSGSR
jgi:hypothetical protein